MIQSRSKSSFTSFTLTIKRGCDKRANPVTTEKHSDVSSHITFLTTTFSHYFSDGARLRPKSHFVFLSVLTKEEDTVVAHVKYSFIFKRKTTRIHYSGFIKENFLENVTHTRSNKSECFFSRHFSSSISPPKSVSCTHR